jgi:hypothetical protein
MTRVCKLGRAFWIIDPLSPSDESPVVTYKRLERLRNPSHTTALTKSKFIKLIEAARLLILEIDTRDVTGDFKQWVGMPGADQQTIL